MKDLEKQRAENRRKYPITSEIVDIFKETFGDIRVKSTNEVTK